MILNYKLNNTAAYLFDEVVRLFTSFTLPIKLITLKG